MKKVLVLVGPTAVGKTSFSIELAQRFHGEIISGDRFRSTADWISARGRLPKRKNRACRITISTHGIRKKK